MAHSVIELYDRIVLKNAKTVLLVFLALVCISIYQLPKFSLDASADSLLLEDDTDLAYYREIRMHYPSGDEFLLVTFQPQNGDVFQSENLALLKKLQDQLGALDQVKQMNSILNVPLLYDPAMNLTQVEKYTHRLEDADVDLKAARKEIVSHPFYLKQLINENADITAIQVILKSNQQLTALLEQREQLRHEAAEGEPESHEIAKLSLEIKKLNDQQVKKSEKTIEQVRAILHNLESSDAQHKTFKLTGTDTINNSTLDNKADSSALEAHARTFLGGVPMIVVDMVKFVQKDLQVFGGLVIFFLILTLMLIFRQMAWVISSFLTCTIATIILTGYLCGIHFPITVISSNFMSLIFITTLAIIIHLIVQYREIRKRYEPGGSNYPEPMPAHNVIICRTVGDIFWPSFYTALTTVVGFISLIMSRIQPIMDFGIMMSIGLCIGFVVAYVFFPAWLQVFPVKSSGPEVKENLSVTHWLAKITDKCGNWLYLAALILSVISIYGLSLLSVENRFIDYFDEKTEIHQGMKLIDRQLGGTTPLDVIIRFPEPESQKASTDANDDRDCFVEDCSESPQPEALLNMERLEKIRQTQHVLENIPGVGKVLSIASTMDVLAIANKGPLNSVELALLNSIFPEEFKGLLWNPYINTDRHEFRISLRIIDSDPDLIRADLIRQIEDELATEVGLQPEQIKVAGMLKLYNNMLESLFDSQIRTVGFTVITIFLMVAALFRSFSLAIVATLPNVLAGAFVLGLMGLMGISLDIMTITIVAIFLGLGIDNAIHYIYRFQEEYELAGDYQKAMWNSHTSIGNGIYYTNMTIIVGFSILVLSSFNPTIYFGFFTSVAMVVALLGSLTFLPRLMLTFKPLSKKEQKI